TLYGGAEYHLYRYKRYTDVRIVFAPEKAIAFFGGDPDNFEYPRYDLDIAFLRAYENGKPAVVKNYLKLSSAGVGQNDLVFVSGNPGRTDRLLTVASLVSLRDVTLPLRLESLGRQEHVLLDYGNQSAEDQREAQQSLFGVQNSLKASRPRLAALQGDLIDRKKKEEEQFRHDLSERPDLRADEQAYERIDAAEAKLRELYLPYAMLEGADAFRSSLFSYARTLVRMAEEDAKPDGQRLPEYAQARRAPLEHRLFAKEPIYPQLEIARLTDSLKFFQQKLGESSPYVQKVLQGKSPEICANEWVKGSKLADVAERRRLSQGGKSAIESSDDPMIALARLIDPDARKIRQEFEAQVEEPLTAAMTQINQARFALFGNSIYPDATGTLRLAFGLVKGYEQDAQQIPPWTTLQGAFVHERQHGAKFPYELPASWQHAKDQLRLDTPLNFVSTADITGGNSGSPIVDRKGEFVGVIFDSNHQGVAMNFAYSDVQARAVAVDVRAILESLRKIYDAEALLSELTGVPSSAP